MNYPRYELTVSISKRESLNADPKLIVQTNTAIDDLKDRAEITQAAISLVDFALFEGWGDEKP